MKLRAVIGTFFSALRTDINWKNFNFGTANKYQADDNKIGDEL